MSTTTARAMMVGARGRHACCIAGQLSVPPANSRAGREPECTVGLRLTALERACQREKHSRFGPKDWTRSLWRARPRQIACAGETADKRLQLERSVLFEDSGRASACC